MKRRCTAIVAFAAGALGCGAEHAPPVPLGVNPHPVQLVRPAAAPLSATARLGRAMFFDARLSGTGQLSCASCHSPDHAYGPPNDRAVQLGGPSGRDQGMRAAPSLRYLDRVPNFSIGPDTPEAEHVNLGASAARNAGVARAAKTAGAPAAAAAAMVPRGGLFWDGRVNTLQTQAMGPLFNPVEMANTDTARLAARLRAAYGARLATLFGRQTVADPRRLIDEALFAVARFEIEDPSFHPYSSTYDAYLEGRAVLAPAAARGLALFDDPRKGNCAACHLDTPGPDRRPPMFTDYQYEALGVPRNTRLRQNRDPAYFDLGLCGPVRTDLARQPQYCGMFRTPSLRNVATRRAFFHNGVYGTLQQVLEFYAFRGPRPERVYPRARDGTLRTYDDLPPRDRGNVDTADAPFDRRVGQASALSAGDIRDLLAFLGTLTDGGRP
ncbi:MAG TPA: cytochrome c peroxidase [Gemmatimonadaceae bacterium]|nr:cytochrome c peroxidase [Gemmatimonadaceae bacterium]